MNFKNSMLRSCLCDYSDAYILVTGTITVTAIGGGNNDIQVVFKKCAPFTNCISEINNTQIDNPKHIDVAKIIQKHQEVYGHTIEMNQL